MTKSKPKPKTAAPQKINILGAEYSFKFDTVANEPALDNKFGLCDRSSRRIVVKESQKSGSPLDLDDMDMHTKETIRHEIIHAYFDEAGLVDTSCKDWLVDWIAIQFPKMLKTFQETGAI